MFLSGHGCADAAVAAHRDSTASSLFIDVS
jgi:hypothetical protein